MEHQRDVNCERHEALPGLSVTGQLSSVGKRLKVLISYGKPH